MGYGGGGGGMGYGGGGGGMGMGQGMGGQGMGQQGGGFGALGPQGMAAMAHGDAATVEAFIAENRLDEGASKAFRESPPAVQAEVIIRGSLFGRANPSQDVMGRIRQAKQALMGCGGGGGCGGLHGARASPY